MLIQQTFQVMIRYFVVSSCQSLQLIKTFDSYHAYVTPYLHFLNRTDLTGKVDGMVLGKTIYLCSNLALQKDPRYHLGKIIL